MQDGLRALLRQMDPTAASLQLRQQDTVVPHHAIGEKDKSTNLQGGSDSVADKKCTVDLWQPECQPFCVSSADALAARMLALCLPCRNHQIHCSCHSGKTHWSA